MLHIYKDELPESWSFWSNCTGDLHHDGIWLTDENGFPDNVAALPVELQRAYEDLWTDGQWASCYLVEFDDRYFVGLQAEYDPCFAEDKGLSYDQLIERARLKANVLAAKLSNCEVVFGRDTEHWLYGEVESELYVLLPWDTSQEDFASISEYFDSMCYEV